MREMVLKNLISEDKRRREIFVSEHTERDNIIQELEKKSVYVIREVLEITQDLDLPKPAPAQTFFIRIHDSQEGKDKFVYKVIGDQYAVVDDKIFLLHAIKYFKIDIHSNLAKAT